jgi:hypothetical protein
MKDRLKEFWDDVRPREWKSFVSGLLCITIGLTNMEMGTWYNHAMAVFVSVMGGLAISASVFGPKFKEMGKGFEEMKERWESFNPETSAKRAAEAFKAHVLEMHARGEFPADVHIEIGDGPPPDVRPPGRLN